jgi:hypothetical protein
MSALYEMYEKTITIKVTVPTGQPANSILPAKLIVDPIVGEQASFQLPANEAWVIDDVFITGTQPIDGVLIFERNHKEAVTYTPPINSLLVSNNSRPRAHKIVYDPFDIITVKFINTQPGDATADKEVVVLAKVKVFREKE